MVVEENSVKELPFLPAKKLFAVKQEVGLYIVCTKYRSFQCCFWITTVIVVKYYLDITE